jgi:Neurotransmitter-gated ion-channel ligand binding domain/Neurotransmitter-gated ion-channel transmembrane region
MFSPLLLRIFAACIVAAHICLPVIMAEEIDSNTDNATRPVAGNGPTEVSVGIYVVNIESINSAEQSYRATVALAMKWNDPRLACRSQDDPSKTRTFNLEEVWNPEIVLINVRSVAKRFKDRVRADCRGNMEYLQIFYGDFLTTANIKDFPFDQRTLKIEIFSTEYEVDEVKFLDDEQTTGRDEQFSITDWNIGGSPATKSTFYDFEPGNLKLSAFTYELTAKRNYNFFMWKIILPLVMIVFMSWSVFWIPPSQIGPQIGLSVTSMLTLIAYRFAIGNVVPNVDYLTRFDKFVFGSTLLVFLALVEAITTGSLSVSQKTELALKIDWVSRAVFPILFAIVVVFAFFL